MSDIRDATVAELSYAAATVDCEGCIQITMRKPDTDTQNPRFGVYVVVVNTDSVLTNWLLDTFGGSHNTKRLTDEELQERWNLKEAVHILNMR